jgi:hypothetical protein
LRVELGLEVAQYFAPAFQPFPGFRLSLGSESSGVRRIDIFQPEFFSILDAIGLDESFYIFDFHLLPSPLIIYFHSIVFRKIATFILQRMQRYKVCHLGKGSSAHVEAGPAILCMPNRSNLTLSSFVR